MSDINLATEATPGTPAAGTAIIYVESGGKRLSFKDDAGRTYTLGVGGIRNFSVASQGAGFAADTYVTGSNVTVPVGASLQVGSQYRCKISLSKTAAGVATPVVVVRIGTAGTTADAIIATFTGAAQTGAGDTGFIEILLTIRTTGAAATSQGTFSLNHNAANAVGLGGTNVIEAAGSTFVSTTASLIVGVSMNYGASAAITVTQVEAELLNI